MLYLKQKTEIITVPKTISYPSFQTSKIQLVNNATNDEFLFDITDLQVNLTSYIFTLDSTSLKVGEYTGYLLAANGDITERYLIQVGEYICDKKEYETEIKTIQYEG